MNLLIDQLNVYHKTQRQTFYDQNGSLTFNSKTSKFKAGTALVASDIHLGSSLSNYSEHKDTLLELFQSADLIVLPGDIIDGLSNHKSPEQILSLAIPVYEELLTSANGKEVHHVLGNHEEESSVLQYLIDASYRFKNLFIHANTFRLHDTLFHHGDTRIRSLENLGSLHGRNRSELELSLYKLASEIGISGAIAAIAHPAHKVTREVATFLSTNFLDDWEQSKRIVIGHTHTRFSEYQYGGKIFYNCGATMKGIAPCSVEKVFHHIQLDEKKYV